MVIDGLGQQKVLVCMVIDGLGQQQVLVCMVIKLMGSVDSRNFYVW